MPIDDTKRQQAPCLQSDPSRLPEQRRVAVLGGDERERRLILALARAGYKVVCVGRDLSPEETAAGAQVVPLQVALASPVVVGPMAGISVEGQVSSRSPHPGVGIDQATLAHCPPSGATWLIGAVRDEQLAGILRARGIEHVNLADHDELATLNSIPSAEGAIMLAMQNSPYCLMGSRAVVVGYGRTAQTLAVMLRGLVGRVVVAARAPLARAKAHAMGFAVTDLSGLADELARARYCFNTVPAMVLTAQVLAQASPELLVIDLASAPGGTDFAAAEAQGIRATLAPSLPGLVAPVTAGDLLAQVVLMLLEERVS